MLDQEFTFEKDEAVFMEISQKYSLEMIEECATQTGFKIVQKFFDQKGEKGYFVDALWEKV